MPGIDPHDIPNQIFSDKCLDYEQDIKRLESISVDDASVVIDVPVIDSPLVEDIFGVCQIFLSIGPKNPIENFAQQLQELARRALKIVEADKNPPT